MSASYVTIQGESTFNFTLSPDQKELQRSWIRLVCKTGGGAITINLPKIKDFGTGLDYRILVDDADDLASVNNIIVNVDPSNTIENAPSYVVNTNGHKIEIYISSLTEFAVLSNGGTASPYIPIIPIVYADLLVLATGNTLVAGQQYLITDYATKHIIPNTVDVFTGAVEPLIVQAISVNQIDKNAISLSYPLDEILYELVDATAQGGDKGRIRYRKDTGINIETWYDWKNVNFRRWETALGGGIFTVYLDNGFAFQDFYTFANSNIASTCENISVGCAKNGNTLNNNIFGTNSKRVVIGVENHDNTTGNDCADIMIGTYFTENVIGDTFQSNKIGDQFTLNTIGISCSGNIIGYAFSGNTINNSFAGNVIGEELFMNSIGDDFANNTIGNGFQTNTILNSCGFNKFGDLTIGNVIGNSYYLNTGLNGFIGNTIADNFTLNVMGSGITGNNIDGKATLNIFASNISSNILGTNFSGNVIGNDFGLNTIGANAVLNKIGCYCNNNVTGMMFTNNLIGNNFNNNGIAFNFSSNQIGSDFKLNPVIGNDFQNNVIDNYFQSNITIGVRFMDNKIGLGFAQNTVGDDFAQNTVGVNMISNTIGGLCQKNVIGNNFHDNIVVANFMKNEILAEINILDFTLSTYVYADYSKKIIKGSDTINYLSYFDGLVVQYVSPTA